MRKVMKEKTGLGITMVLAILMLGSVVEAFSGAGSGTEQDPYVITDVYQLQEMNDDLDAWYELGNNIDASTTSSWNAGAGFIPIGASGNRFTGHFDGKDHKISGLYINRTSTDYIGLFGRIYGNTKIKNVALIDIDISGNNYVGGLIGTNNYVTIINSYSQGSIEGNWYVGGLVGFNNGIVTDCHSTGSVSGSNWHVGGLIGCNSYPSGVVSSSYSRTSVHGDSHVGGLVGFNDTSTIADSYSTGSVNGTSYIGGSVGLNYCGAISNSYSMGNVGADTHVGGFLGCINGGTISNSYSTGSVDGNTYVGGFLGYKMSGTCQYCFWDIETSGQTTSACGTGKTTAEMKQEATFTNWDFDSVWDILENITYPFLRGIGWNPPDEPEAQIVVLDWENDVPVRIVSVEIFGTTISIVDHGGTMPAATGLSSEYRTNTLQRVQQIFIDSDIDNVVITDTLVDGATFVYFTDRMGDLMGKAYTGTDRFNRRSDDGAVVFAFANAEVDAETVAHEVGHTLGLRHVDPDIAADPYNASVMDPDYAPDVNPRFINVLSNITDFLSPYNHNPVYHLKRYVDGVSHDDLVVQGIYQGTWDMRPLELIETVLDFGSSDRVLYNVSLLVGAGDDSIMTIANFDVITLSELSELEFTVENGDLLQLVASSTLGGDLDTLLAMGDPNEEANLLVQPVVGQFKAYLQTESDSGPGYVTIAEPNVSGAIFDPNSDFDRDGDIDIVDLSIFVSNWLGLDCGHLNCWCEGTDLNYNGSIDFIDFAIFAENWPGSGGQGGGMGGMGGSSSQQMELEQQSDIQPVQQVQPRGSASKGD